MVSGGVGAYSEEMCHTLREHVSATHYSGTSRAYHDAGMSAEKAYVCNPIDWAFGKAEMADLQFRRSTTASPSIRFISTAWLDSKEAHLMRTLSRKY